MYDAFVVALAVFIGVAGHEMFGMSMLSRPIVVAPLAGALMGDLQTGLIVGASLEAIFMGVVNIGISSTAELLWLLGWLQRSQSKWEETWMRLFPLSFH
ncbi:hypothetical protein EFP6CTSP_13100 [Enterococcus faecium]|nr:hypothetical protein EFP6CTSP_13100 [Enterococcus faecium]